MLVSKTKLGSDPRAASEERPGTEGEHTPEPKAGGSASTKSASSFGGPSPRPGSPGSNSRAASEGRPETKEKPKAGAGGAKNLSDSMPPEKTLKPKPRGRSASTSKSTPEGAGEAKGSTPLGRPSAPAKEQKTLSTQAFFTYLSKHAKLPPSSDKISDAWQVTIAEYISFSAFSASSHTFANPMNEKIALAIAKNLGMFTNPEAQESIAKSIFEGKLGEPMSEDVALAIAKNLGTFTNDDAQKSIAESINTGKFGNSGEFGDIMSEAVAIAIADKLHIFTNEEARKNISAAIANGLFGGQIPNSATSAIVKNLVMFTNTEAQRNISTAISEGRFSDGHFENPLRPIIAVAIAKNLPRFTDAKAQLTLSAAMAKGVFGNPIPQDVNKALLSILGGSGLGA